MPPRLLYSGARLDRATPFRGDDAWTRERLEAADTRIVPVWRTLCLILPANGTDRPPAAATLAGGAAQAILAWAEPVVFLGLDATTAYFAADVSAVEEDALLPLIGEARFEELRQASALLAGHEAGMLAFARGLVHWHHRQRFCGDCGSPTASRHAGHIRACINPACGKEHFPRTDAAVITLVTRQGPTTESCLLARQARWPPAMYSSIAGFVEPGESLEEAVAREVREETGIEVTDIRYRASQPWPFPASLMIAFRARATTFEIALDDRELEDARWFSREEIAHSEASPLRRARSDSIARWLLEEWLAETAG